MVLKKRLRSHIWWWGELILTDNDFDLGAHLDLLIVWSLFDNYLKRYDQDDADTIFKWVRYLRNSINHINLHRILDNLDRLLRRRV